MKASSAFRMVLSNPFLFLSKVRGRLQRLYNHHILRDSFTLETARWFRDKGDENLRFKYDLDNTSVVVDVGGYVGEFASEIYKRFGCSVYVFEPSEDHFYECVARFKGNSKIHCFNFGLGDANEVLFLSKDADSSSVVVERSSKNAEPIKMRKFSDVYLELGIEKIDLIKINIEGAEYLLLPHIISEGIISKIQNVQVQFHNFVLDAENKRNAIISSLNATHREDWCYKFVWESWSRKK